jgi:hypothetical protein
MMVVVVVVVVMQSDFLEFLHSVTSAKPLTGQHNTFETFLRTFVCFFCCQT